MHSTLKHLFFFLFFKKPSVGKFLDVEKDFSDSLELLRGRAVCCRELINGLHLYKLTLKLEKPKVLLAQNLIKHI